MLQKVDTASTFCDMKFEFTREHRSVFNVYLFVCLFVCLFLSVSFFEQPTLGSEKTQIKLKTK